ncbi:MAG TPA: YggS family pyridoxal phosphate-dependent enzyme [Bacteroidales bacterium]|nr:YggS family pyridoxal phosphate-dependent enzyme [Bacteroidales bacterium]
MSDIASNIISVKKDIPSGVKLVAVSKTKSAGEILEAYSTGHRLFGENRVQELLSKKDFLPRDIEWHLIGHLQSNKVKYIVPFITLIQSVDSYKLLKVINSEAEKINRRVDCLLQFHIAREETKFGFNMKEAEAMISSSEFGQIKKINLCGVMGMATFTEDEKVIRDEFRLLTGCFKELKNRFFPQNDQFREISMGMSGDYKIAIEEGSTLIRIGSIIFGERNNLN